MTMTMTMILLRYTTFIPFVSFALARSSGRTDGWTDGRTDGQRSQEKCSDCFFRVRVGFRVRVIGGFRARVSVMLIGLDLGLGLLVN